jgi:hypothetical protein
MCREKKRNLHHLQEELSAQLEEAQEILTSPSTDPIKM